MSKLEEINDLIMKIYEKAKEKIPNELQVNKVFQFQVQDVGDFYIEIKNGVLTLNKGIHNNPNSILTTDYETLIKILKKELDPMNAFLRGKLKITKNVIDTITLRKLIEAY